MPINVGTADRLARVVVGVGLLAWALGLIPTVAASPWGWIGLVPLLTALAGTCPAYSLLGISTCHRA